MKGLFKVILICCVLFCSKAAFAQHQLKFRIEKVLFTKKDPLNPYKWMEVDSLLANRLVTIDVDKMYILIPQLPYGYDSLTITNVEQNYIEDDKGATMVIFHYKDADGNLRKYSLFYTMGDADHKAYYSSFDEDDRSIRQCLLTWISGTPK